MPWRKVQIARQLYDRPEHYLGLLTRGDIVAPTSQFPHTKRTARVMKPKTLTLALIVFSFALLSLVAHAFHPFDLATARLYADSTPRRKPLSNDTEAPCTTVCGFGGRRWTDIKRAAKNASIVKASIPVKTKDGFRISELALRYPRSRATWDTTALWDKPDHTLVIVFLDHTNDKELLDKVQYYAEEWEKYANLTFDFRYGEEAFDEADVAITFYGKGWASAVGNSSKKNIARHKPSMHLELTRDTDEEEFRRHVFHEFGHVLGFEHEHQNPKADIKWREQEALDYFKERNPNWTDDDVRRNVLKPLSSHTVDSGEFDPFSIMIYSFPSRLIEEPNGLKIRLNTELSEEDKSAASLLYPLEDNEDVRAYIKAAPGFLKTGVLVCAIDRDSPLRHLRDAKGRACAFRPGSLVKSFDQSDIKTIPEFARAVKNARSGFHVRYIDPERSTVVEAVGPTKGDPKEWPNR
jgi:hypothetical protein